MGTNLPSAEELEKRAARERAEVEQAYTHVRRDVREKMDVGRKIQRRPAAAYGAAAIISLLAGYKIGRALKD